MRVYSHCTKVNGRNRDVSYIRLERHEVARARELGYRIKDGRRARLQVLEAVVSNGERLYRRVWIKGSFIGPIFSLREVNSFQRIIRQSAARAHHGGKKRMRVIA